MHSRRAMLQKSLACTATLAWPALHSLPASASRKQQQATETLVYGGDAFGTRWSLALPSENPPAAALAALSRVISSVNLSMSPFDRNSEISRFNQSPAGSGTSLSAGCSTVIEASLAVATQSQGAFDPTVGPWVNRYGFGPIRGSTDSHFTDIVFNAGTLEKKHDDATLDLCGIAKGYALDKIVKALANEGYSDFLVELGGELMARGAHPSGRSWLIQVEQPAGSTAHPVTIKLDNAAIATSGLVANSFTVRNRRYGHLLDPRSGKCANPELYSVSVVHESAMLADAWSTALFVLGEQKGPALAKALGLDAVFVPATA